MSVIAVKITKNEIIIGSDTQATKSGYMKFDATQNGQTLCKLEQFENLIIGAVGDSRMIRLMPLFLITNKLGNATEMEIVRFFHKFESWLKIEISVNIDISKNAFLVVFENKVFEFQNYFIREIKEFWAMGSGAKWALPALELGADVKKAVEVACKFDLYCSGEPKILTIKI